MPLTNATRIARSEGDPRIERKGPSSLTGPDRLARALGLDGSETYTIRDVAGIQPRQDVEVEVMDAQGATTIVTARCRIDTYNELEYFHAGGILPYVLRKLAA